MLCDSCVRGPIIVGPGGGTPRGAEGRDCAILALAQVGQQSWRSTDAAGHRTQYVMAVVVVRSDSLCSCRLWRTVHAVASPSADGSGRAAVAAYLPTLWNAPIRRWQQSDSTCVGERAHPSIATVGQRWVAWTPALRSAPIRRWQRSGCTSRSERPHRPLRWQWPGRTRIGMWSCETHVVQKSVLNRA